MPAVVAKKSSRTSPASEKAGCVWLFNGRLVSTPLSDPALKNKLAADRAQRHANLDDLRKEYVKAGMITEGGRLTKRYGG